MIKINNIRRIERESRNREERGKGTEREIKVDEVGNIG
jgi:hypothetical protein